jgi:outer membrane protein OmpA-like peptidoglycan-associated protein/tetratricopeptide (TPR) repeat protein
MKKYFLLSLLLVGTLSLFAQRKTKAKADKAYKHLGYLKAVDLYQQLGEEGLDLESKAKLANSFRLNGDTESAEYWYEQVVKETADPSNLLHYAQVLQSNHKCQSAIEWYDQYLAIVGANNPLPRAVITDCEKIQFLPKRQVRVQHLQTLNSGHLEYSPIPYKGGIVYTSTKALGEKKFEDQWTKDNFSDLFFAELDENGHFGTATLLEGEINGAFHDGTATFNAAGTQMYFSRNNDAGKNSKDIIDLKIYQASLKNGKWQAVAELPFNDGEYATCHPTLAMDGNTLYFASNRPGGFGGMDLYRSVRKGNEWSKPENLGKTINTAGNEIFPFIAASGDLYFASDGLPGIGGLDIYRSSFFNKTWSKAENLGEPINSAKDDFSYCVLPNEEEGYFSSNRIGGLGGDDIYHWSNNVRGKGPAHFIAIIDEQTGNRLSDALVTVIEGVYKQSVTEMPGRKVNNANATGNNYAIHPISLLTDFKGKVKPEIRDGKTYTIFVEKPGYEKVKKIVNAFELLRSPEWIIPISKRKGLPLNGSIIHEKYNHFIPNAEIELFNFCTGEYERTFSDEKGNFEFFLDCNCDYELVGKKERFTKHKKQFSTLGMDCQNSNTINAILYLEIETTANHSNNAMLTPPPAVNIKPSTAPNKTTNTYKVGQIITLENVYYDFNKASIRGDASESLNKVVELLKEYPSMEIQLLSHTDARGKARYNKRLSQKRANAAVQYLIAKGIQPKRLSGIGYGEEQLKNHCDDDVDCDEKAHQENRRTEIKITKLDKEVEIRYRN